VSADIAPAHYRLDDLRIDVARQRVVRDDGQVLDVSGLSFRLLHVLLGQGTRVVGFDELIDRVWSPAHVGEETVTQRVRLLRRHWATTAGSRVTCVRCVVKAISCAASLRSKPRCRRPYLYPHDDAGRHEAPRCCCCR